MFDGQDRRPPESMGVPRGTVTDKSQPTKREMEVAALVAKGHSNKLIGDALCISAHTAKFHLHNLMHKLKLDNRASVAVWAYKKGLL